MIPKRYGVCIARAGEDHKQRANHCASRGAAHPATNKTGGVLAAVVGRLIVLHPPDSGVHHCRPKITTADTSPSPRYFLASLLPLILLITTSTQNRVSGFG